MHKLIISTLLLITFSSAETSYSFLGAQTSYVNYENVSAPSIGLKYGVQRGMWRSSFNLDYSEANNNQLNSLILQVDKGVLQQSSKNSLFKPHVGFSLGILQHDKSQTDKGYAYGVNTGVTYLLNNAIDLDLSYRYLTTEKMNSMNSLHSLNLSLHYFY